MFTTWEAFDSRQTESLVSGDGTGAEQDAEKMENLKSHLRRKIMKPRVFWRIFLWLFVMEMCC